MDDEVKKKIGDDELELVSGGIARKNNEKMVRGYCKNCGWIDVTWGTTNCPKCKEDLSGEVDLN